MNSAWIVYVRWKKIECGEINVMCS